MATTYTINAKGRHYIRQFIELYGRQRLRAEPWYCRAEDAADDGFGRGLQAVVGLGVADSADGRPHTLVLEEAWFDAAELT